MNKYSETSGVKHKLIDYSIQKTQTDGRQLEKQQRRGMAKGVDNQSLHGHGNDDTSPKLAKIK